MNLTGTCSNTEDYWLESCNQRYSSERVWCCPTIDGDELKESQYGHAGSRSRVTLDDTTSAVASGERESGYLLSGCETTLDLLNDLMTENVLI